jgi:CxxC motif-containing protein
MSRLEGVYSCGNAMHVNDLADYVSESGEIAGKAAASKDIPVHKLSKVQVDKQLLYVVPEVIDFAKPTENLVFYFRVKDVYKNKVLRVFCGDNEILKRVYQTLRPPEMERIVLSLPKEGDVKVFGGSQSMKEFTCIVCPNGCSLHYDEATHTCTGNRCPRGAKYAENEVTHPMRSLTTTVKTSLPEYPVISVRTSIEVPKGMIPEVMKEINKVLVKTIFRSMASSSKCLKYRRGHHHDRPDEERKLTL